MKELDAKQCVVELAERGLEGRIERVVTTGRLLVRVFRNNRQVGVLTGWTQWWDIKRDPCLGGMLPENLPADSALARARARAAAKAAANDQV